MVLDKVLVDSKEFNAVSFRKDASSKLFFSIAKSCSLNSAAQLEFGPDGKVTGGSGSQTEVAILHFLHSEGIKFMEMRKNSKSIKVVPFNSVIKKMYSVFEDEEGMTLYIKGAPSYILEHCTAKLNTQGEPVPIEEEEKKRVLEVAEKLSYQGLRSIAIGFKRLQPEIVEEHFKVQGEVANEHLQDIVLQSLMFIVDKIRPETQEAVALCRKAGLKVIMVTGDTKGTAESIAKEAGILDSHSEVMENSVLSGAEFYEKVGGVGRDDKKEFKIGKPLQFLHLTNTLKVIYRANPKDKFTLVTGLKEMNEVVAVTGDGTNDAPALKRANVGLAMGISGTDAAKKAAGVILMDDSFASIVTAVKWGRNIYDSIRKFLQFQVVVNITALVCSISGSIYLETAPLTTVQMLWINLIMDSFASLALATEPPTPELLERAPVRSTDPIISWDMRKFIAGHSFFQITFLMSFLLFGHFIIDTRGDFNKETWWLTGSIHMTMFFESFVFLQVFNFFNARKIQGELNVFTNLFDNFVFWIIILIILFGQLIITQFGGNATDTSPLNVLEHGICLGIGMFSILLGFVMKLVPDVVWKFILYCLYPREPSVQGEKSVRSNTEISRSDSIY